MSESAEAQTDALSNTPRSTSLLPSSWLVQLPIFEGPLDLLLHLIKVNEVEITDIPVALICDQFHEYLGLMEELDLDVAGEYIYEAAKLIQLKSRMLLPRPETIEGLEPEEDPRQELVRRLIEYRKLKEAAQTLAEVDSVRGGIWKGSHRPVDPDPEELGQLDMEEISLFDLLTAFSRVLQRYDLENPEPIVFHGEQYSVRGQIEKLVGRLSAGHSIELVEYLLTLSGRSEAIAAFLAILEMTRLSLLRLVRSKDGEIVLSRTERAPDNRELELVMA